VLSPAECQWIISESEKYAAQNEWHTKRHDAYATVDLELTEIESLSYFALNLVYGHLIPLINTVSGESKAVRLQLRCGRFWCCDVVIYL
jgi:hypothetical protein